MAMTSAEIEKIAQQTLLDLGFKSSIGATNFLRDCIVKVIQLNCCPVSMYTKIYVEVGAKYNTSGGNVMTCARSSLESVWKHRPIFQKENKSGVSFNEFKLCPSLKKFIYYVAESLNKYLTDLDKFKS